MPLDLNPDTPNPQLRDLTEGVRKLTEVITAQAGGASAVGGIKSPTSPGIQGVPVAVQDRYDHFRSQGMSPTQAEAMARVVAAAVGRAVGDSLRRGPGGGVGTPVGVGGVTHPGGGSGFGQPGGVAGMTGPPGGSAFAGTPSGGVIAGIHPAMTPSRGFGVPVGVPGVVVPGGYAGIPGPANPTGAVGGYQPPGPPAPPTAAQLAASRFDAANAAAYRHAGVASNLGFGGYAQTVSSVAGFGRGLNEMGMTGLGAGVSRAAPYVAAVKMGLDTAANAADVGYNPYLSHDQQWRAGLRGVLPGPLGYLDRFSGRNEEMRAAGEYEGRRRVEYEATGRYERFQLGWEPGQAGRDERMRQLTNGPGGVERPDLLPGGDRTTGMGEQEFRRAQLLLPARRQLSAATREQAVADKELVATKDRLNAVEDRGRKLEEARLRLQEEIADKARAGSGAELQRKLLRASTLDAQVQANRETAIDARTAVFGAEQRAAGAAAQVGHGRAGLLEAEAQFTQERAVTVAGKAQQLGGESPVDRIRDRAFAELAEANKDNLDSLPPEVKAGAARFAPRHFAKVFELGGTKTEEFKRGQALFPEDFGAPGELPEGLRQKAVAQQNQAAVLQVEADQRQAAAVNVAGAGMADAVLKVINQVAESFKREIQNQFRLQNNQ